MTNATSERPVRVLLIDDDEDDYLLTRDLIADIPGDGYELAWESDFDAALDRISRGEFDVYLIDFRLGARSGLDLLRAKQERGYLGPVILLTGVGQPEIDRQAEAAGADDFLEKSRLDPVLLERSIRYALRQQAQEVELDRKVRERTAELAAANASLQEADRRKNVFLATLAHELRNPLAPIRHALEILRLTPGNPPGTDKARQILERQVRHMVRLIDDLLDASRISRNSLRIELLPTDLREPIQTAIESAAPLFDEHRVAFRATVPDDPIPISADGIRLSQLFANLLTNAAKYTESGGSVTLEVERTGTHATVRVTDTGIGIHPDILPHLFDLFTQADPTAKRSQGGLGIGLALAKHLAEMHGGTVSARSEGVGRGSEFVVTLPLLAGE